MHVSTPPAAVRPAGLPPHALALPVDPQVRLFADAADAAWLIGLIAAHQALPEIARLGVQCWMLHVHASDSARLTCHDWRGGPALVSLLVPPGCLHLDLRRDGAQLHEFLVARGALWTEPAWTRAGEGAMASAAADAPRP